jgi:general secretion pathway protein L
MIGQLLHIAENTWRWWLSEFLALLPQAYLKRVISSPFLLVFRPSGAITKISVAAGEKRLFEESIPYPNVSEEALGRLRDIIDAATGRKRVDVIGVIGERQSLVRPLTLPHAAKAHLDEAVRYQIERLSPFRADNTLYDFKRLDSGRQTNELRLKLTIVSKASVAELEHYSAKFGFRIDRFAVEPADGGDLETVTFASEAASRGKMPLENKAILTAAFILLASLVLVPIVSKWEQSEALEKEINALKPKAEQVLRLRSERDKIVARHAQMIGMKRAALPPVAILSKLSELLDDQTFLFDMRTERAIVTISGLSPDASKLAQRLGAIEAFKSVKFSGPVTRDVQSARDRFTLVLEMAAAP